MKKIVSLLVLLLVCCSLNAPAKSENIPTYKSEDYLKTGIENYKNGEFDEAINDFQEAIKINAELADAYFYLGCLFEDLEEYNLAIENYQKAIDVDSNHAKAYHKMAIAYYKQGKHKEAVNSLEKAIDNKA